MFNVPPGSGRGLCHPNPCQHGGVCEVTPDRQVTCDCPVRYGGDRCQISKGKRMYLLPSGSEQHEVLQVGIIQEGILQACHSIVQTEKKH